MAVAVAGMLEEATLGDSAGEEAGEELAGEVSAGDDRPELTATAGTETITLAVTDGAAATLANSSAMRASSFLVSCLFFCFSYFLSLTY